MIVVKDLEFQCSSVDCARSPDTFSWVPVSGTRLVLDVIISIENAVVKYTNLSRVQQGRATVRRSIDSSTVRPRPVRRSSVIARPALPDLNTVIGHRPGCRHPQAAGHWSSVIRGVGTKADFQHLFEFGENFRPLPAQHCELVLLWYMWQVLTAYKDCQAFLWKD